MQAYRLSGRNCNGAGQGGCPRSTVAVLSVLPFADEGGTMTRNALVLGGGGALGISWEIGLLAGLTDEAIDVAGADRSDDQDRVVAAREIGACA